MTVAVLVAGQSYNMVKEKKFENYSENLDLERNGTGKTSELLKRKERNRIEKENEDVGDIDEQTKKRIKYLGMPEDGIETNVNKRQEDMGPYRRLSMLATASLLESVNMKSPEKRINAIDPYNKHEQDGVSNGKCQVRRNSSDSTDGLDENMLGGFSRRGSMFSVGSTDPGVGFDSAIVSRRLSLIAAQAASLESRNLTRRASLIAAAEIFESLSNDAASRRRSSILGSFDKRMSFDRRNSLLAVSALLSNIESGNGGRRSSTMFRRGSEMSLGSVFSSLGESDVSSLMPSRRSSLDTFNTNINVNRSDHEAVGKAFLGVGVNGKENLGFGISSKENDSKTPKGIDMESFKSLYVCMEKSKASQTAIHDWDRKMGLRRSHSQTMRNSSRSRKKLITVMTLSK